MSYMQEFEAELVKRLHSKATGAELVRWIAGKVLESYRNGIKKGAAMNRDDQNRRQSQIAKAA